MLNTFMFEWSLLDLFSEEPVLECADLEIDTLNIVTTSQTVHRSDTGITNVFEDFVYTSGTPTALTYQYYIQEGNIRYLDNTVSFQFDCGRSKSAI